MKGWNFQRASWKKALLGTGLLAAIGLTGCQVDVGGQTLPSSNYLQDDVQYFAPGPQFKLSREAAAMTEYNQQQQPVRP